MAKFRYAAGFTRNMGNFESLRVEISFEDDLLDGETTDEGFNRIKAEAADRLAAELADVAAHFKGV